MFVVLLSLVIPVALRTGGGLGLAYTILGMMAFLALAGVI